MHDKQVKSASCRPFHLSSYLQGLWTKHLRFDHKANVANQGAPHSLPILPHLPHHPSAAHLFNAQMRTVRAHVSAVSIHPGLSCITSESCFWYQKPQKGVEIVVMILRLPWENIAKWKITVGFQAFIKEKQWISTCFVGSWFFFDPEKSILERSSQRKGSWRPSCVRAPWRLGPCTSREALRSQFSNYGTTE